MVLKSRSNGMFEVELNRDELLILAFALGWASMGPADDAKFRERFGWAAPGPPPSKQELISMREVAINCIDALRSSGS